MSTRIDAEWVPVTGKDGKTKLVKKRKRYDACTELKQATSKRVRVKKRGQL